MELRLLKTKNFIKSTLIFCISGLFLNACASSGTKFTSSVYTKQKSVIETSTRKSESPKLDVEFVNKNKASQLLAVQDEYISALSEFDWQAKFKSDKPLSRDELFTYYQKATLSWDVDSKAKINIAIKLLQNKLDTLSINQPKKLKFLLTNGLVESGAAYTREDYIVFSTEIISGSQRELNELVAHEFFHVYSRLNKKRRDEIYETINFNKINSLILPEELDKLRISNPDEPQKEFYAIKLNYNDKEMDFFPLLAANTSYIKDLEVPFFAYIEDGLLAVEIKNGKSIPYMSEGKPLFVKTKDTNYNEVVKPNSNYLKHPEEVLAENFGKWVIDEDVKHPQPIKNLLKVMQKIQ